MFPVQSTACSNANPVKPARSKLFKVPHTFLLAPENFSFTFAINHGCQVVGLLYSPILSFLVVFLFVRFLFDFPLVLALCFAKTAFPEFTFFPRCVSVGVGVCGCVCVCVCLLREASQKHKSKRQDKFRRSAVG